MAALGILCCTWAFSSCSEQRLLWVSECGLLTHCSGLFWSTGFSSGGVWAQQLWWVGLVALQHVGSSWTRDQKRVPGIGRLPTTGPPGKFTSDPYWDCSTVFLLKILILAIWCFLRIRYSPEMDYRCHKFLAMSTMEWSLFVFLWNLCWF